MAARTAEELNDLVEYAMGMLVKFHSRRDIRDHLMQKFGMKKTHAYDIIKKARELLCEEVNRERPELVSQMIATLEETIVISKAQNNYSAVCSAVKTLAQITGIADRPSSSARVYTLPASHEVTR